MSFQPSPVIDVDIDIVEVGWPASYAAAADIVIPIVGTGGRTSATISSNQITLPAGSHYRLELSYNVFGRSSNFSGELEIQWYSVTGTAYIGQSAYGAGDDDDDARTGRICATALILNSEISTSLVLEARIKACTTDLRDGDIAEYGSNPTLRIMELPA